MPCLIDDVEVDLSRDAVIPAHHFEFTRNCEILAEPPSLELESTRCEKLKILASSFNNIIKI